MWSYGPIVAVGALASKSNSRQKTSHGFIKSNGALEFCDAFAWQVRPPKEAFVGLVALYAVAYYPDWRKDLDLALLKDCIQKAGIIKNDRSIVKEVGMRGIDKKNPRVVFMLHEISEDELAEEIKRAGLAIE